MTWLDWVMGRLYFESLLVVPEVAESLFPHAVREAEGALAQFHEAEAQAASLGKGPDGSGPDRIGFTLWAAALDRTVPSSIAAIVLAVATAEGQVNEWLAVFVVQGQDPLDRGSESRPPKDRSEAPSARRLRTVAYRRRWLPLVGLARPCPTAQPARPRQDPAGRDSSHGR